MKKILIGVSLALLAALWIGGSWVFFNSITPGGQECGREALAGQELLPSPRQMDPSSPFLENAQFDRQSEKTDVFQDSTSGQR
ncbi:MAG: hypothetical protein P4L55_16470 [Syntrophobacteraceae bacterium]|nr:hypothetical protein [Syntrophobacteraceae bacterium]